MPRPIFAKIYPESVACNLARAKTATHTSASKVWVTIKANAYGHGIERIYDGLCDADGLAMLDFSEARRVRDLGWNKPVLMLEGCFSVQDYSLVQELALTVVVHHEAQIDWLLSYHRLSQVQHPINFYLKLNTGMNRVGFSPEKYEEAFYRLRTLPFVGEITLMTHFANADVFDGVMKQMILFNEVTAPILVKYPQIQRSCSNSAAVLKHAQTHFDWIRPGLMIYGGSPFSEQTAQTYHLQAAMTLGSELISLQTIKKGDGVGYGSRFVAKNAMTIGVVACGYADGYPRHAPDGTPVWVNEAKARLVGTVSMDMMMVDLTNVPDAKVGSPVELWGKNLPIDEVAQSAGTSSYELMCALAQRVPVIVAPL